MGGIELGKSPCENRIAFISASIAQRLSHGFPRRPMQNQTELKVTSGIIPDVDFSYLSFREAYLASRLSVLNQVTVLIQLALLGRTAAQPRLTATAVNRAQVRSSLPPAARF